MGSWWQAPHPQPLHGGEGAGGSPGYSLMPPWSANSWLEALCPPPLGNGEGSCAHHQVGSHSRASTTLVRPLHEGESEPRRAHVDPSLAASAAAAAPEQDILTCEVWSVKM